MRFIFTLIVAIILLKVFLPEVSVPVLDIISSLLQMLSTFLENFLSSIPGT
ncbi:hypothetical protein KJ782_04315 [Patescibacteria group bacterium]|nr:hypothetical protein [Patescibacteria group bacterium]